MRARCSDGYQSSSGLVNCSDRENTVNTGEESCLFDLAQLGKCAQYPYGYVVQPGPDTLIEPCLLLKFNKVNSFLFKSVNVVLVDLTTVKIYVLPQLN